MLLGRASRQSCVRCCSSPYHIVRAVPCLQRHAQEMNKNSILNNMNKGGGGADALDFSARLYVGVPRVLFIALCLFVVVFVCAAVHQGSPSFLPVACANVSAELSANVSGGVVCVSVSVSGSHLLPFTLHPGRTLFFTMLQCQDDRRWRQCVCCI